MVSATEKHSHPFIALVMCSHNKVNYIMSTSTLSYFSMPVSVYNNHLSSTVYLYSQALYAHFTIHIVSKQLYWENCLCEPDTRKKADMIRKMSVWQENKIKKKHPEKWMVILKGQFTQKWTFCHHLLTLKLFQTCMNFFLLLSIK